MWAEERVGFLVLFVVVVVLVVVVLVVVFVCVCLCIYTLILRNGVCVCDTRALKGLGTRDYFLPEWKSQRSE